MAMSHRVGSGLVPRYEDFGSGLVPRYEDFGSGLGGCGFNEYS